MILPRRTRRENNPSRRVAARGSAPGGAIQGIVADGLQACAAESPYTAVRCGGRQATSPGAARPVGPRTGFQGHLNGALSDMNTFSDSRPVGHGRSNALTLISLLSL